MSLHTEFDKGSLIWVKGEIEETFVRAKDALQQFAASGDDASLKHAQTYLHQVCGALTLVDLAGLARFCEEIELVVARVPREQINAEAVALLQSGIESASGYLERLMAGMSNTPLLLHPLFRQIAALRGASQSGAELFFPQLQLDLPAGLPKKTLPEAELPAFIRKQRSRFESSLLRWLQGQPTALQGMAASLVDVATYQHVAVVRSFWWTAAGLSLGFASHKGDVDLDIKQLMLRLNLQMRRLSEGSSKVAERLFRDMLYVLARMDCDSNLVRHLQRSFLLESLLPSAEAMAMGVEQGALQLARSLREDLRVIKDSWSRIAGGQHDRLNQFGQQLAALAQKTHTLSAPPLEKLWQGLAGALKRYGSKGPTDLDSLEFATGLLLADNALAVYPDLSPDYAAQVDALLVRLVNPSAGVDLPQLDSFSREAQERLLLAQIAQEIRVNLRSVEETLDSFFRDSSNKTALPSLADPMRQVQGALMMLDRPNAVQVLTECQKRIDVFIQGQEPQASELDDLAEALSMLGFYIDDLEQGREKEETLRPALVKLCGVIEEAEEVPAINEVLEAEPEMVQPGKPAAAAEPEPAPPAPEPESRPLPVSDAAIDAELLEVYLEEAVEVLAAVSEQLGVCKTDVYDREALTLIRRSFHTLKGSGRMVGLFNLGEVAWAVEQCLNKQLQDEKPATRGLLELIAQAHDGFEGWIKELQEKGVAEVEASALIARAAALRDGAEEDDPSNIGEPSRGEAGISVGEEVVAGADTSAEVVIGDVSVSPTLFDIFCEEAEKHLESLRQGLAQLQAQGLVEQRFILAAHTLGGIVSTTGFRPQGSLAYALEHALQKLDTDAVRELPTLNEAVQVLDEMLTTIFGRRPPAAAPDLVARLNELRAQAPQLEEVAVDSTLMLDLDASEALDLDVLSESGLVSLDDQAPDAPVSFAEGPTDAVSFAELEESLQAEPEIELPLPGEDEPLLAEKTPAVASESTGDMDLSLGDSALTFDESELASPMLDLPLEPVVDELVLDAIRDIPAQEELASPELISVLEPELPLDESFLEVDLGSALPSEAELLAPVDQHQDVLSESNDTGLLENESPLPLLDLSDEGEQEIDELSELEAIADQDDDQEDLARIDGLPADGSQAELTALVDNILMDLTGGAATESPVVAEPVAPLQEPPAAVEALIAFEEELLSLDALAQEPAHAPSDLPTDSDSLVFPEEDEVASLPPESELAALELDESIDLDLNLEEALPEFAALDASVVEQEPVMPEVIDLQELVLADEPEAKEPDQIVSDTLPVQDEVLLLDEALQPEEAQPEISITQTVAESPVPAEEVLPEMDDALLLEDDEVTEEALPEEPVLPSSSYEQEILPEEEEALLLDEALLSLSDDEAELTAEEAPVFEEAPIEAEVLVDAVLSSELETLSVAAAIDAGNESLASIKAEIEANFQDDIDDQLLPVFVEESDELMPQISAHLHALADGKDVDESFSRLKRTLHTMKGSARMSGAMRIGEAAHRMESRLEGVAQPDEALLTQLDNDYDLLQMLADEVSGRSVPAPVVAAAPASGAAAAPVAAAQPVARALALAEPEGKATIRVKSELVDELVNQAGEVSIARSRIEAEMLALRNSLSDLTENVVRLRIQLREIEIQAESQMQAREKELQEHEEHFDPLEFDRFTRLQELTRFLAESVNDVGNVQQSLVRNLDESTSALTAQARMTRDLQQSLMRVRLVPFNSVAERLYRLARTTGKEIGKKVNLEIKGGAVEIDRGVLEKMISPFEHMLRNAIDHGLEDIPARLASGKPEFGEILIEARQEGNELVLLLKDDGRGLNLEKIRAKGIEKKLIRPDQVCSDHDLAMLIFEAGFSTASNVTQLSGRGIGMDVVKTEIVNLGGRIDLSTQEGHGTLFTIRLPLTLAVTQVLLVRSGERLVAIPSVLVEQVQELKLEALSDLYAKRELEWMGQRYRFAYLPRLLGDLYRQPEQKRYSTVLLLRSGADRIALHIDSLVKNLEVVVKQIGPQLARVPGVVGATVLGNGEIVLMLNPILLLPLMDQITAAVDPAQQTLAKAEQEEAETLQTVPIVMVVDDSLTVRKITGRLLTREGFQVAAAKDGVDALQQLQEIMPSVMLVDIEMPRMDGFEFTRNVRATPSTRHIPIIMITSRTADKHRKVAFDLGVNVFLGKPYQEDELLGHIRRFIEMQ